MRRVIRQLEIVADDWQYLATDEQVPAPEGALLVPFARWCEQREALRPRAGRLGVRIGPVDSAAALVRDFDRLVLIAVEFGGIGEGRGYSQAQQLRRSGFTGELRAVGRVSQDQIWFMARSGFDAFDLADPAELEAALAALERFSVAYQPGDERLVRPQRRRPSSGRANP
jgi:uncharacterized protein (DUF934 family)